MKVIVAGSRTLNWTTLVKTATGKARAWDMIAAYLSQLLLAPEDRHLMNFGPAGTSRITEVVSGACGLSQSDADHPVNSEDEFTLIADGVDGAGEDWAKCNDVRIKRFYADWDQWGKSAGPIRNGQMAHYADALLAFRVEGIPNRGTDDMIRQAADTFMPLQVQSVCVIGETSVR